MTLLSPRFLQMHRATHKSIKAMKYNNLTKLALGAFIGLQMPAIAGPAAEAAPASKCGEWCSTLKSKPKLYSNMENPYIQEIGIEGRLQWQTASTELDDVTGADFNELLTEFRRARLGTKIKCLNYFTAKYQVNMVDDDRPSNGDIEWDYQDIDEAYLEFDLGKALNITPSTLSPSVMAVTSIPSAMSPPLPPRSF